MDGLDRIARIFGTIGAWLVIVYYKIRHPFKWKEKFQAEYNKRTTPPTEDNMVYIGERTPEGRINLAGDMTLADVERLHIAINSFARGNTVVPKSDGEYISIKSTVKKEVSL